MEYDEVDYTIEPVDPSPSPSPELRALYDGDISSTVLEKLSGYYIEHSDRVNPEDYFIVRQGQYDYILYYGDIESDGSINDATVVRYYAVNTGSYAAAYRLSVSESTSGSVDLGGYSGYIYSSYESYLPSPYISTGKVSASASLWITIASCLFICATVGLVIWRWFNAHK